MTFIANLHYWPDAVIVCLGLLLIYALRTRPPNQLSYIPIGTIAALWLWIGLRTFAWGDAVWGWLNVAVAVGLIIFAKPLASSVATLGGRKPKC